MLILLFSVFQHGSNLIGMTDLNVPEQLYQYMVGGHRRAHAGINREKHKSPSYQIKVDQLTCAFHVTHLSSVNLTEISVFY